MQSHLHPIILRLFHIYDISFTIIILKFGALVYPLEKNFCLSGTPDGEFRLVECLDSQFRLLLCLSYLPDTLTADINIVVNGNLPNSFIYLF